MIDIAEVESIELFAALEEAVRSRVVARSADLHINVGEWIVHEDDPAYFWVVLDGEVEAVRSFGGVPQQVTTFDAGEYFGEVPLMLGAPSSFAVRALRPTRMMRVDPIDFHAMIVESPAAGGVIAKTLVRRVGLIGQHYTEASLLQATIVGDRYDFACHNVRDFLLRNQIPFNWLDPSDPADANAIASIGVKTGGYPVVTLRDGRVLKDPSQSALADALGLQTQPANDSYDVVIVGGGPAGLAAAVYGGSEGLRTVLVEREAPGGQAGTSSRIENYLGFPGGVSGSDLANRALLQAKRFGTEILVTRSAVAIECDGDARLVRLDDGGGISTRAVVIATGVAWRRFAADGAERFIGRGIYYGAARTEALETRGRDVFLIGGGNSAGQAAMFFANYARSVTLLVRGDTLEKSMSQYLIDELRSRENISVETQTSVRSVAGESHLESIVTHHEALGETSKRSAGGLFVFIGADAETNWLPAGIERDAHGYIRTGRDVTGWTQARAPYALETSIPGIFAAGDVRSASVKRVAAGVGEGSMVISFIHQYFEELVARRAGNQILRSAPSE
jgi:thioredoxin reductase (NADPH)